MLTLDQILAVPAPPPHTLSDHSPVAEGFREKALQSIAMLQLVAASLENCLRLRPDDDEAFEYWAGRAHPTMDECGAWVQAFRDTRDVQGEA